MAKPCKKIPFDTQKEANAAILGFWRRRMGDAKRYPTRSYLCDRCGKWHMTSQPKRP